MELLVIVHLAALVVCNVVEKPTDETTKLGKWFWLIQIAAGIITDKVKK